jgi:S-formylglutathione hydrolase FrmB
VAFIDARYRTRADRRDRGLAGQSMGGFGALSIAQGHADTFGSVYAMSPCCLDLVGDLAPGSEVWKWAAPAAVVARPQAGRARIARAMAAAFAPTEALRAVAPGGRADSTSLLAPLPFVEDANGAERVEGAVLQRWRAFLPVHRLTRDPSPLRRACAVGIDFGTSDEIASVPAGARAYSAALTRAGIVHTLSAFDGKHVDRTRERFEQHVLPFFSATFSGRRVRPGC